ncbi:hypothetical protein KM043_002247 [Ampulex compressa]|nr:hypothetical protein KM043_002247 [Ampulex compressa]
MGLAHGAWTEMTGHSSLGKASGRCKKYVALDGKYISAALCALSEPAKKHAGPALIYGRFTPVHDAITSMAKLKATLWGVQKGLKGGFSPLRRRVDSDYA